jgi:hypothetical protein
MTKAWIPLPFPWVLFAVLVLSILTGCIETETPERTVIRPVRTVTGVSLFLTDHRCLTFSGTTLSGMETACL